MLGLCWVGHVEPKFGKLSVSSEMLQIAYTCLFVCFWRRGEVPYQWVHTFRRAMYMLSSVAAYLIYLASVVPQKSKTPFGTLVMNSVQDSRTLDDSRTFPYDTLWGQSRGPVERPFTTILLWNDCLSHTWKQLGEDSQISLPIFMRALD